MTSESAAFGVAKFGVAKFGYRPPATLKINTTCNIIKQLSLSSNILKEVTI